MLLTEAHLRKTTNIRNSYTVAMMCMQSTVVSHTLKKDISYLWQRRLQHSHDHDI